jgi:CRP-like cAMP-binding protein
VSDQLYLLRKLPIFQGLKDREIEKVFSMMEDLPMTAGSMLFAEGSESTSMFIVWTGAVEVFVQMPDGSEKVLAALDLGDCLGEMGLIRNTTRSASARTSQETLLMVLKKERLDELAGAEPRAWGRIMANIAVTLADRLDAVSRELKKPRADAASAHDKGFFARLLGM